jgi:transcriptional regulator with XRE-family HTH domain
MGNEFGEALRRARIDAGLTQVAAARNARIPATTWAAYERGIREPRAGRAKQLAAAIGAPVAALYATDRESVLRETVLGADSRARLMVLAPADRELEILRLADSAAAVIAAEIRSVVRKTEMRDRPPTTRGRKRYRTVAEMERAIGESKIRRAERLEQQAREQSDQATGEL